MDRIIIARWRDWATTGIEHLVLHERPDGFVAEAVLLGTADGVLFAARYRITGDHGWRVRTVASGIVGTNHAIELASDGAGAWTVGTSAVPVLVGAIDVDLSATPFTNTLPIRRLGLAGGQAATIVVVYIRLPDLTVAAKPQRYTCLEPGRRYRFESLDSGFSREIDVDDHGLVVTYPGLFARLV